MGAATPIVVKLDQEVFKIAGDSPVQNRQYIWAVVDKTVVIFIKPVVAGDVMLEGVTTRGNRRGRRRCNRREDGDTVIAYFAGIDQLGQMRQAVLGQSLLKYPAGSRVDDN